MFQRALYVDHFSKRASKIDIYVCSELFDRSAGLLAGLMVTDIKSATPIYSTTSKPDV